jgi:hypothetical protein
MKRKLTIEIDIDTDRDQRPNSRAFATWRLQPITHEPISDTYKVKVGAGCGIEPNALISTIAHELGHILGTELRTPGQINDPRITRNFENEGQCIVNVEAEAWNLAARIFRETREIGLGSYERELGIKAENLEEVL